MSLYDRVPQNLTSEQRERTERDLSRMACMMVDWFADRAFTCPDSLPGTIETYKGLVLQNAHNEACPVCKGPIVGSKLDWLSDARILVWDKGSVQLSKNESAFLDLLWRNRTTARLFDRYQIASHVWGSDPDGGPDSALDAISVLAFNIRRKIKSSGLRIASTPGQNNGYRLEHHAISAADGIKP